jgi:hypothetical protein
MKKLLVSMILMAACLALPAFAADDPLQKGVEAAVASFVKGCEVELNTFCKGVTPGEGRILACLYAFEDKISPRCQYALYDSLSQLDRTVTNLSYTVNECRDDLETFCADIEPGGGRLLDCLKSNGDRISSRCSTALKDAGYWK